MKFCLLLSAAGLLCAADYDLVIRNARVIDGTGNPWYRADVALSSGKIAAIGKLAQASAARTIDAKDRVLAPGVIDVHTHVEGGVEKVPGGDNYLTRIFGRRNVLQIDRVERLPEKLSMLYFRLLGS